MKESQIERRYDVSAMSTKGMSVTAARQLVECLSEQGVTVLVLRDFDKAGFSIVHTLSHNTRRYQFRVAPRIIDIGLRLSDVHEMGLPSEPIDYREHKDPRVYLRERGATDDECKFLVHRRTSAGWTGERVELNAMTSEQFISFIERKLKEVGQTPVYNVSDPHARISAIGAITVSPPPRHLELLYHLLGDNVNFRGSAIAQYLSTIRSALPGPVTVLWDRVLAERMSVERWVRA